MTFVHTHVHGQHSLMDGIDSPTTLVKAAARNGQPGMALTDHGVLSGHRELYRAAQEAGIKPVFGVEAYISPTDRFDKRSNAKRDDGTDVYNHLVLLAKNQRGYDNLNAMSRIAWTEGFYNKPRIDTEVLFEYREDVIVLTGCLSGIPAKLIDRDEYDRARQWLSEVHDVFGEDLYVEVQAHNPDKINNGLQKLAVELDIEMVATSDCHRAYERDADLQDAFLAIATSNRLKKAKGVKYKDIANLELLDALNKLYPDRSMTFQDFNLFIQSREEITADFDGWGGESIFDNSLDILDKVGDYTYHSDMDLLPKVSDDPDDRLEDLCLQGMKERDVLKPEYQDRLDEELRVIKSKNFSTYFLILEDVVNWCEEEGIFVAPGRGSAVGSLVCYLLGITHVDPLEYDLLFARFINEERNDFPDVDIDVEKGKRYKVKQYVKKKYGHTANIITYGHYSDKSALKAAASVLAVPYGTANKLSKKISDFKDYETSKDEFVVGFRKKYQQVLPLAKRLEGRISQSGMHAGGVVMSSEDITKYAPVETKKDPDTKKRVEVVALDMNELEDIGVIKFDFLANKSLDVIVDTAQRKGMSFDDIRNIPLDDEEVLEQFDRANTAGVFQCDTVPYRKLLEQYPVKTFKEVVASNALVRPGAMNTIGKEYIARANGEELVTFLDPIMEGITKDTLGEVIYQEQVMLAAVELGGLSWSDADRLRKIIGKKQDPEKFAKYKQAFMDGATEHISFEEANKLWTDFEAHAGYSFNKSHSVAYSIVSMWTMWMRVNYPQTYMAALLRTEEEKKDVARLLVEMKKMDLPVYMPHVNESGKNVEEYKDGIRFGLCNAKYISDKSYANIVKHRPYSSVDELWDVKNTKYSGVNVQQVEALKITGALQPIGGPPPDEDQLYDYLGLPTFEVPEGLNEDKIDPVDEFSEEGTYLLSGMVQKVKRDKHWTLIDIIDESGTVGFFDGGGSEVQKGEFYYFLVADNRVVVMVTAEEMAAEMESDEPSALTKYLTTDTLELLDDRARYVLYAKVGRTRAGKRKADVVAAGKDGVHSYKVYHNKFSKVMPKIREGRACDFKVSETHWGAVVINDVR